MSTAPDRENGVDAAARRWAASGAMALTGRSDGPGLGPPGRLVDTVDRVAAGLVAGDALPLLGERAAHHGFGRRSPSTCGGSGRLMPCRDGWIAASLARPSDLELLPAWLGLEHPVGSPSATAGVWALVERAVESRASAELRERAALLGLPAALVGSDAASRPPVVTTAGTTPRRARSVDGALVVDLSSLWAGPLCGQLLAEQGARVLKVESTGRPDGARQGAPGFFDLLNGAKRSVALDLTSSAGRSMLGALLRRADLVIEASRPRALDHLGLGAEHHLAGGWAGVWVSITGYGRSGADATRVAFGDDAAAAGGLVVWEGGEPRFCADAAADPLAGLTAAAAAVAALARDGTWLLDVSMAAVSADAAGPTVAAPAGVNAAPPRSRPITHEAAPLGADTAAVLAELAIAP